MRPAEFPVPRQLDEVYDELGQILQQPELFGIHKQPPRRLADAVRSMRQKLRAAIRELRNSGREDDLEVELSEDFDHAAEKDGR